MNSKFPTLRPFYYLDHFQEMLGVLETRHGRFLGDPEKMFIFNFRNLSRNAQALLVRMTNRSAKAFRISILSYEEIGSPAEAIAELIESGFLATPTPDHAPLILGTMKRGELLEIIKRSDPSAKNLSQLKKPDLLELACVHRNGLLSEESGEHVIPCRCETLDYLLFLYFGRLKRGMKSFALRDLGIVKTAKSDGNFEARFKNMNEAGVAYRCAVLSELVEESDRDGLLGLLPEISAWSPEGDPDIDERRDRVSARLGKSLERCGEVGAALKAYVSCGSHPARERRCRIHYSMGDVDAARELLDQIIDDPLSDDELLFAEDFQERKFGSRKVGRLTGILRNAPTILVDESFRDSAEKGAVDHFTAAGCIAFRTENLLWKTVVGLLFWDEFQSAPRQNEFDPRPTQWLDGTFTTVHEKAVFEKLVLIEEGQALPFIKKIILDHNGTANGMFQWKQYILAPVCCLFENGDPKAIAKTIRRIVSNPRASSSGYPDLMIFENGQLRFTEIKAEGDQIRRHQLLRIEELREDGFAVDVTCVNWHMDPQQEYVVIDIETTGGRAGNHRITEIGAVKIRGEETIAVFSTLVNPDRKIPGQITKLTGIDDAMVADAPSFGEIANDLKRFIGNSVFVAHSATFDFGFIRSEFVRIGERFRAPTICTVVAMRRYFPGLPSYSLGKLCKEFSIPLESHHRALCDATATAELLKLINRKRISEMQSQKKASLPVESEALDKK